MKTLRQQCFDLEEDNTSMDHMIEDMTPEGAFREYVDWHYGGGNGVWMLTTLKRFNLLKEGL